jgi:anthranilate phosphoribosyltransferase
MADLGDSIDKVCHKETLGREGAKAAMDHLVSGDASEIQAAAFLGALGARGVDENELVGFAESLRAHALGIEIGREPLVDTCGTGGDGLRTFNFSTAAALVAAGAGAAVAKHGNRAVSSRSGSADVLEALGIATDASAEDVRRSVEETGFGFLFAPRFHPAMRHIAPVRSALGVRTVFNLLGPLANPAGVKRQVVGVYDGALVPILARVLATLGAERAMVVHGEDGMDELSPAFPTRIAHVDAARGIWLETVAPEEVGLRRTSASGLAGGDARRNARLLEDVLEGREGPLADGTSLNAGAALLVAGQVSTLRDGVAAARESIASGRALEVVRKLRLLCSGEIPRAERAS